MREGVSANDEDGHAASVVGSGPSSTFAETMSTMDM